MQQVDAVARELGHRGKPEARPCARKSGGGPPGAGLQSSLEPPAPARTPVRAPVTSSAIDPSSFTPSVHLSSPAPVMMQQPSATDASLLVEALLEQQRLTREREDTLRQVTSTFGYRTYQ
jgi:hypothetical protein